MVRSRIGGALNGLQCCRSIVRLFNRHPYRSMWSLGCWPGAAVSWDLLRSCTTLVHFRCCTPNAQCGTAFFEQLICENVKPNYAFTGKSRCKQCTRESCSPVQDMNQKYSVAQIMGVGMIFSREGQIVDFPGVAKMIYAGEEVAKFHFHTRN